LTSARAFEKDGKLASDCLAKLIKRVSFNHIALKTAQRAAKARGARQNAAPLALLFMKTIINFYHPPNSSFSTSSQ